MDAITSGRPLSICQQAISERFLFSFIRRIPEFNSNNQQKLYFRIPHVYYIRRRPGASFEAAIFACHRDNQLLHPESVGIILRMLLEYSHTFPKSTMSEQQQPRYRWYILALGTATHIFVVAMARMSMPVLFQEISEDLNLDLVQIGMIWGIVGLSGIFTAFIYGNIGDRFGASRMLSVACLLVGITGALRGTAADFTGLATFTFLFGLFGVPLSFATHKAAGEWFSKRQLGLANGILAMGMGMGVTVGSMFSATAFSPMLGGWRNLMFVYGGISVIISLLWFKARQRARDGETASTATVPFRQALSHIVRIRQVWLMAISGMFIGCGTMAFIGYLPLYLRSIGWPAVSADGALAAMSATSVIGVIPLSLLSDRIGLRKAILYPSYIITIVCLGLLSYFTGGAVWPVVISLGIVREGLWAIVITMIMEIEGVGAKYAGAALGLMASITPLGNFLAPPIGNRLALIEPGYAFLFWAALGLAGLAAFYFVRETGWKKQGVPRYATAA
jgi:predicted MFS family arabinose efflux permease